MWRYLLAWFCISRFDAILACDGQTDNLLIVKVYDAVAAISHIHSKLPSVIYRFQIDLSRVISHIFDQSVICVYVTDSEDYEYPNVYITYSMHTVTVAV